MSSTDLSGLGGQLTGVQVDGQTTTLVDVSAQAAASGVTVTGDPASTFDDALAALSLIESQYEGLEILSAVQNQGYDTDGALVDTVDVSFRIFGRPGAYTVSVPFYANWAAIAFFRVGVKAQQVEQIYEGLADSGQATTQLLVPPPPSPPTPVPRPGQTLFE